ncbi:cytochrome P450 [Ceratobasidium sp. AG-I]|nr:cytochrome P450 [Ceratobasidium sp. AG-I]
MPSGQEHLAYLRLGKELNSDIIFLEMLGTNIVVLNSAEAASDLMDKRSALYSGRACPPVLKDPKLFGWQTNPGLIYGGLWRHHRRMMNHWLNIRAVTQFNDIHERQTRILLGRLLDVSNKPRSFDHVKDEFSLAMAALMFQLTYGYPLDSKSDLFFAGLMETMHHKFEATMYTNFYVNLFPALVHVPDWFPGTGWKRTIRAWGKHKDRAISAPFEWTRDQVEAGVAEPSIIGALLQDHSLTSGLSVEERDNRLQELGMAIFTGGSDANTTVLVNFVAAMVKFPQVQAKAQQEIEELLGLNTLPSISDQARLPYVKNLILELYRWRPVSPTAVPHECLQDDVYRGYDILKGTIMAMTRDEKIYGDPEVFNPDRFLDPEVPHSPVFGWGRRKCPGIHFSDASLFVAVASLLSAYTFFKRHDESGEEIEPVLKDSPNSLVLELEPFEFDFKPRSEKLSQLLQGSA